MSYTSQYPVAQNSTYVKSTTEYAGGAFSPHFATDPTKSLTGDQNNNGWLASSGQLSNQRIHIDLGSAKVITRFYYENAHQSGILTGNGVKNFTFWGSNTGTAFAELTYATDTDWTQLTTSQSTMDRHTASDAADPKYTTVTNSTAYRYYAFKFADIWANEGFGGAGLRRVEVQTTDITTAIKKVGGVAYASVKKVSGVAIASVKELAGVA